jgi:2-iminobutanoate/2-iminopropanoate deaminase
MANFEEVHPHPPVADMPYTPAIRVKAGSDLLFISGATALPLYHSHPHVPEEEILPDDIAEQTRRTMDNIKLVLDSQGLTFRDVVKVTKYVTDMREVAAIHVVLAEYFGDWKPASTLLCVNNLSSPGSRLELDMIAVA